MIFSLFVAFSAVGSLLADNSPKRRFIRNSRKVRVDIGADAQVTLQATSNDVHNDDAENDAVMVGEDSALFAAEDQEAEEKERQEHTDIGKQLEWRECPLTSNEPGQMQSADWLEKGAYVDVPPACACAESNPSSCPVLVAFFGTGEGIDTIQTVWSQTVHDLGFLLIIPTKKIHSGGASYVKNLFGQVSQLSTGDIFAGGHSKGGAAAQKIAARKWWPIKGVLASAAPLRVTETIFPDAPKVCYIEVHGDKDGFVPYNGEKGKVGYFKPVMDSMQLWADHNNCSGVKESELSSTVVFGNQKSATFKTVHYVWDCPPGQHVEHYNLKNFGAHIPPFSLGEDGFAKAVLNFMLKCRAGPSTDAPTSKPTPTPATTSTHAPKPDTTPTPASSTCKSWCAGHWRPWSEKCKWKKKVCAGCPECLTQASR